MFSLSPSRSTSPKWTVFGTCCCVRRETIVEDEWWISGWSRTWNWIYFLIFHSFHTQFWALSLFSYFLLYKSNHNQNTHHSLLHYMLQAFRYSYALRAFCCRTNRILHGRRGVSCISLDSIIYSPFFERDADSCLFHYYAISRERESERISIFSFSHITHTVLEVSPHSVFFHIIFFFYYSSVSTSLIDCGNFSYFSLMTLSRFILSHWSRREFRWRFIEIPSNLADKSIVLLLFFSFIEMHLSISSLSSIID